jgi:ApaG protein
MVPAIKTTKGVTIIAVSKYESDMFRNAETPFNFSYHIQIINESEKTLQLMRREWRIFDSSGSVRMVKGEGVVGEQPILAPGSKYEYSSWCGLFGPIGNMVGSYEMINVNEVKESFKIAIPKFVLCTDYLKN